MPCRLCRTVRDRIAGTTRPPIREEPMKADFPMRRSIFVGAFAAAVSLAMPACDSGRHISIGVISPVTGPVALDGESFRHGAELATKEINAAGGVLGSQLSAHRRRRRVQAERIGQCRRKADGARFGAGHGRCALQPGDGRRHSAGRTSESAVRDGHFECAESDGDASRMVLPLGRRPRR